MHSVQSRAVDLDGKSQTPSPASFKSQTPASYKIPTPTPPSFKSPTPTPIHQKGLTPPTPDSFVLFLNQKGQTPTPANFKSPTPTPASFKSPTPTPASFKSPTPTPVHQKGPTPPTPLYCFWTKYTSQSFIRHSHSFQAHHNHQSLPALYYHSLSQSLSHYLIT